MLGCYGNTLVKTPNIDRLAESGTIFKNAYCNFPVCGPSRASIMTSLRPETVGVMDLGTDFRLKDPDVLSLPEHFKNNGYRTAGTGKIYDVRNVDNSAECDKPSWSIKFDTYGATAKRHASKHARDVIREEIARQGNVYNYKHYDVNASLVLAPVCADEELPDGAIAQVAMALMNHLVDGHDSHGQPLPPGEEASPFFLAVGFNKPHLPFWAPKRYWDLYNPDTLPDLATADRILHDTGYAMHDSFEFRDYYPVPRVGPISKELRRQALHGYLACISYVDALVGRVLQTVDDLGLRERMAIVLWGDHGFHLGDHGMYGKHSILESGANMPLIIIPPGGSAVRTVSSPVELIDVFPTLCDLAKLPIPPQLQGRSLVPLLTGAQKSVREGAITLNDAWWDHPGYGWSRARVGTSALGYSYRTNRYRFTQWVGYTDQKPADAIRPTSSEQLAHWTPTGESAGIELYDYQVDPGETRNLAYEPSHKELLRGLAMKLRTQCDGCERLIFGKGGNCFGRCNVCPDWCATWTCTAQWCEGDVNAKPAACSNGCIHV